MKMACWRHLKNFRVMLGIGLAFAGVPAVLGAQQSGTITGVVTDQATQRPLNDVQILVVGTQRGALTDQDGRYAITGVPTGTQQVRAVLIGYAQIEATVEVAAGESATADIAMRTSALELEGLVVSAVTGRAERKRALGTNTASISSADLDVAPITRMADVLAGRTAGVQLQGVNGGIGTSQRIRIRGANSISLSNEPLIFVDGIQFSNNKDGMGAGGQEFSRLNDINPEDIANIEVLKGPAASALYGTAASNGVILINTRRGTAGTSRWRAYAEVGTSEDRATYPRNYMTVQRDDPSQDVFQPNGVLNFDGNTFCANESAARGDCSQDETVSLNPFRSAIGPFQTGLRQKYGLSVSGGGDLLAYFLSADFEDEEGVISFNDQDRWSVRANVGTQVHDNLNIDFHTSYARTKTALNSNDNSIFSPLINGFLAAPMVPSDSLLEPANSAPGLRPGTGFGYFVSDIGEILSLQTVDRFLFGGTSNWRPIEWLSVNANVGLDYFSRAPDEQTLQPGRLPIGATFTPGFRDAERTSNYIYTFNAAGVASFDLTPSIRTETTLGGQFTRERLESTRCFGVGIVEGTRSCSATSSLFEVEETFSEVRTAGAYLQEQVAFNDRLFLGASLRADDVSAFGQDSDPIYYPGASASWVVSEESFFPRINVLSSLRLRAAFGVSGQRPNFRDAVTLLDPTAATVANDERSAVRLRSVGNPELKPERTTEFEFGFDTGLLDDRLGIEFTYFNKKSKDALVERPLPGSVGLTGDLNTTGSIWDNLGSIKNWGTELAVNAQVIQLPTVRLDLRLSASTLDNRIEDLGEDIAPIVLNRGNQQHKQGFATGAFFARTYEIVNPGEQRLLSRDDVVLSSDSVVFIGRSLPTNTQSIGADLSLFGNIVRISSLFERRAGHYQLNFTEQFRCQTGFARAGNSRGSGNCAGVADPNAPLFEQARHIANVFGALDPETGSRVGTTFGYMEKADFIKWRELSVTLSPPESLARSLRALNGLSLTVSGRNLVTWTDYTGIDPEINETGGDTDFNQGEFNTQPPLRYFLFRVNYNF